MDILLGISVYLGHEKIEKQAAYIEKMNSYGFKSIFTSLHIPEDDRSQYKNQLFQLGQLAKKMDMELMADISPSSLKELGYDWDTASELLGWGLAGLRIDYGIDEDTIVKLSKQMRIALNASTIDEEVLRRLKEKGLRTEAVEVWHNFYPRPETALGWEYFVQKNKQFKKYGLTVMAFIPGDEQLRGPLFEKLPTVERHRQASPFASFIELSKAGYVDKILIGDIQVSEQSLYQFQQYENDTIVLRCKRSPQADREFLKNLRVEHTNRADPARDVIRSVESRHYAAIGEAGITPNNCLERPTGTITVDNEKYLRYQGELQITVNDLLADERINVLGNVIKEDQFLVKHVKGNQKFMIQWIE